MTTPRDLTPDEWEKAGEAISCLRCGGSGIGQKASTYQPWDEECGACGGSGRNWRYPRGAIAKHYGGALIGRDAAGLSIQPMKGQDDE